MKLFTSECTRSDPEDQKNSNKSIHSSLGSISTRVERVRPSGMGQVLPLKSLSLHGGFGSLSEIVVSQRLSSAIKQLAEPIRYPFSAAISSQFGQKRNEVTVPTDPDVKLDYAAC